MKTSITTVFTWQNQPKQEKVDFVLSAATVPPSVCAKKIHGINLRHRQHRSIKMIKDSFWAQTNSRSTLSSWWRRFSLECWGFRNVFSWLLESLNVVKTNHKRTHLDGLGCLQRLFRWDSHLPLPQELLGEVGDVSSRDGDVLYTAADNVTFSLKRNRGEERGNVYHSGIKQSSVVWCFHMGLRFQALASAGMHPRCRFVPIQQGYMLIQTPHLKYILQAHFLRLSHFQSLEGSRLLNMIPQLSCKPSGNLFFYW